MKLYHILLGATLPSRYTEQHDVFFGIAENLKGLVDDILNFWPEAKGKIHIDAWREVKCVDGHSITVVPKNSIRSNKEQLFFINLGGYKPGNFTEYHFQKLIVAPSMEEAIKKVKQEPFYTEFNLPPHGHSHVDNKYGLDVDDILEVEKVLPIHHSEMFSLLIEPTSDNNEDELHLGYYKLDKL